MNNELNKIPIIPNPQNQEWLINNLLIPARQEVRNLLLFLTRNPKWKRCFEVRINSDIMAQMFKRTKYGKKYPEVTDSDLTWLLTLAALMEHLAVSHKIMDADGTLSELQLKVMPK